jgi:hypothetical protein
MTSNNNPEEENFIKKINFFKANLTNEENEEIKKIFTIKTYLLDPISNKSINIPVKACKNNHVFDRDALIEYLKKYNLEICPLCNQLENNSPGTPLNENNKNFFKETNNKDNKDNKILFFEEDVECKEKILIKKKKKIEKILKVVNELMRKKKSILDCFNLINFGIGLKINDVILGSKLEDVFEEVCFCLINFNIQDKVKKEFRLEKVGSSGFEEEKKINLEDFSKRFFFLKKLKKKLN